MLTAIFTGLLVVVAVTPWSADAQRPAVGDAISVRTSRSAGPERRWGTESSDRPWTEATVVRVSPDTLWYTADGYLAQVALNDAEVRRATGRDHRWLGAVLGGVPGAAIGGLIAYHSFEPEYNIPGSIGNAVVCALNNCNVPQSNSRSRDTWAGVSAGASIGGLIGYFIGRRAGRWESVDLFPSVAPAGTVSMSVRVGR